MNNYELEFEKFYQDFKKKISFLNVKNFNNEVFNNLKIKYENSYVNLSNYCIVKNIDKKKFLIIFNNQKFLIHLIKKKFFENYGFTTSKKKNEIEITIPNLSNEFRNNFIKIIKQEYVFYTEILENLRKKILINIKNKYNSKDEIFRLEKIIKNDFSKYKIILKNEFLLMSSKILNE